MKRSSLYYIILLMAAALVGLVLLQFHFIKQSYRLKSQLFDQSVSAVLSDVTRKIEKEEALNFIKTRIIQPTHSIHQKKQTKKNEDLFLPKNYNLSKDYQKILLEEKRIENEKDIVLENTKAILAKSKKPTEGVKENLLLNENASPAFFGFSNRWQDSDIVIINNNDSVITKAKYVYKTHAGTDKKNFNKDFHLHFEAYNFNMSPKKDFKNKAKFHYLSEEKSKKDSSSFIFINDNGSKIIEVNAPIKPATIALDENLLVNDFFDKTIDKKERIKVFEELATEMQVTQLPIKKRINPSLIDSFIRVELNRRNINLPYELKLSNDKKDSVYFSTASFKEDLPYNKYNANLFEKGINNEQAIITLYFPTKEILLLNKIGPTLISSIVLVLILLICFAYTLISILRQKKLSEMKNDFINNMTHEFKTPVSTILLASEALKDTSIFKDKDRLQRLAGMIYDENIRMSNHIERVLSVAKMEKEEIRLTYSFIDLHDLISSIIEKMNLQLAKKNTKIETIFNANPCELYTDALHLENIITNLIDNANKYSHDNTTITIKTMNGKNGVNILIKDQGIGMSKDQIKKVFDLFYRVSTGNIHNVKGFGIGLHYVYSMIKQLNGSISVKSEIKKGSEFSLYLPYKCK